MTFHKKPQIKVAETTVKRIKEKLKNQFRMGRGSNIGQFIHELPPILLGWVNYYSLAEELDGWIYAGNYDVSSGISGSGLKRALET